MKFQPRVLDVDKIFKEKFMKFFEFKLEDTVIKARSIKAFRFKRV